AAPEEVPGSKNARSLNRANGENAAMQIRNTPGTAVPMVFSRLSAWSLTTPVVIETPSPSTRATRTGDSAAAWNQRNDFQNQERENPLARPAAAIGPVATSTNRAPARASISTANPNAPSSRTTPMKPSSVARTPSVTSSTEKRNTLDGSQWANSSTPNMACMT